MSAPQKVTAYELALRLHGQCEADITSQEMVVLAAQENLVICLPRQKQRKTKTGIKVIRQISILGAIDGDYDPTDENSSIQPGVSLTRNGCLSLPNVKIDPFSEINRRDQMIIDDYFKKVQNSFPLYLCEQRNIRDDEMWLYASPASTFSFITKTKEKEVRRSGLIFSMSVFDDLEREAEARAAQKHEAG